MKLIDIYEQRLWSLVNAICGEFIAEKDDETYLLSIDNSPNEAEVPVGKYQITKSVDNCYQLRANASLGLYAVQKALEQSYSRYKIRFDLSSHPYRISMLEPFREKKGALMAYRVNAVNDYDSREDILFTVFDEEGNALSGDIGHKMMDLKTISCTLLDTEYVETDKQKEMLSFEQNKYNEHLQNDTSMYITAEMQKLDALKDEMLNTLEEKVIAIRKELNEIKKRKRVAIVAREQVELASLCVQCEKKFRRAQQELFNAQDEYDVRVEEKLEKLKCALDSKIYITPIFAIDWELV
jgi:hypothetical protein